MHVSVFLCACALVGVLSVCRGEVRHYLLDLYHTATRLPRPSRAHTRVPFASSKIMRITGTGWRRPVGCLIFVGNFPQKSPIVSGSFAKNDRQLEASYGSLPPRITVIRLRVTHYRLDLVPCIHVTRVLVCLACRYTYCVSPIT